MNRNSITMLVCLALAATMVACGDDGGSESGSNNATNNTNNPTNNPDNNRNNPTNNPENNTNTGTSSCAGDEDCAAAEVCDTAMNACQPACGTDADCAATHTCGSAGFCTPRPACTTADQCGDGEVCNSCVGRCEVNPNPSGRVCVEDTNCFDGEFCDTCRGTCRPVGTPCDPCVEDTECGGAGDLCLDLTSGGRVCAKACGSDSDCPVGFGCDEVEGGSQCVPRSGSCVQPGECDTADDCPFGMMCSPLKACVAGCVEGGCPNNEVCDFGACKPPCADTSECSDGAECTDGLCRIPGGCLTSRDCADSGTFCDLTDNMCKPGCEADRDCPGLKICRNNACVTRPCDGNYLCAFGQVCDKSNGMCVAAEGPFCDPCDAEGENQCGGEPNMCLRTQDEDGNELGDFCGVGCDPNDLDACPVGYGCQTIMDMDGNDMGSICWRACHRDPI